MIQVSFFFLSPCFFVVYWNIGREERTNSYRNRRMTKKNPQVSYPFFVPLRCARRHTEITERKGHILSIYLSLSNSQFHKTIGHHRVSCEEKSFLCLYKQTNKKKLHCKTNKIRKKSQIKSCLNSKSLFYQFIHIA